MANTYTRIYVQIVFAVMSRQALISSERKEELQQYMTGVIQKRDNKLIAINCMPDHTHILVGLHPKQAVADLVEDIKTASSNHINGERWVHGHFNWQVGYGAFSYSHSHLNRVIQYIQNQERHHARRSFHAEFMEFLKRFEVDFELKYIFPDMGIIEP